VVSFLAEFGYGRGPNTIEKIGHNLFSSPRRENGEGRESRLAPLPTQKKNMEKDIGSLSEAGSRASFANSLSEKRD